VEAWRTLLVASARDLGLALLVPLALFAALAWCASALRLRLTRIALAARPFRLLLLLGVACHEWGHALAALTCGSKVREVSIRWDQGHVRHDKAGLLGTAWIAAGPLVSSTALALLASRSLVGVLFSQDELQALLHAPPNSPDTWLDLIARTSLALGRRPPLELAGLTVAVLCLGGCMSAAVPSRHDLRQSAPSWLALLMLGWIVEVLGRGIWRLSPLAAATPGLAACSSSLAIALATALLAYATCWPLALLVPD
jgi:Peptidase M50B-like